MNKSCRWCHYYKNGICYRGNAYVDPIDIYPVLEKEENRKILFEFISSIYNDDNPYNASESLIDWIADLANNLKRNIRMIFALRTTITFGARISSERRKRFHGINFYAIDTLKNGTTHRCRNAQNC